MRAHGGTHFMTATPSFHVRLLGAHFILNHAQSAF